MYAFIYYFAYATSVCLYCDVTLFILQNFAVRCVQMYKKVTIFFSKYKYRLELVYKVINNECVLLVAFSKRKLNLILN